MSKNSIIHVTTQHQIKPRPHRVLRTEFPKGISHSIKSAAKLLKIIMFSYGKKVSPFQQLVTANADLPQNVTSARYPYLTDLEQMERQGLVIASEEGLTFCKEWNAK